ncbi:MAG: Endoglucanase-like protein [Marmoricola sp.]|nr:Endoglucanase-like protein [Marmoricola sp.]
MTSGQHRAHAPGRRRALLAPLAAAALLLTVIGSAAAFYTSSGTGTGNGTVGTLNPPSDVAAVQAGADVEVSWSAPSGALSPTGYLVERAPVDGGSAVPACGTAPTAPSTAIACTDDSVDPGTYTYRVTALFRTWTAVAASAPVTVVATGGRASAPETETATEPETSKTPQRIEFTSSPHLPIASDSSTVTASGGASGKPVTFSSETPDVCTIADAVVHFVHAGTCTVNADQDGNAQYDAAPRTQQSFGVGKASQTISFGSAAPDAATVGGASYTPVATGGGSGKPVVLTIDSSSVGVCSISEAEVSYQAPGTCTVNADQAGDADHLAAGRVQQSYSVEPASEADSRISGRSGN